MLLSSFCHHFQTLLDPFLPAYIRNDCQERQERAKCSLCKSCKDKAAKAEFKIQPVTLPTPSFTDLILFTTGTIHSQWADSERTLNVHWTCSERGIEHWGNWGKERIGGNRKKIQYLCFFWKSQSTAQICCYLQLFGLCSMCVQCCVHCMFTVCSMSASTRNFILQETIHLCNPVRPNLSHALQTHNIPWHSGLTWPIPFILIPLRRCVKHGRVQWVGVLDVNVACGPKTKRNAFPRRLYPEQSELGQISASPLPPSSMLGVFCHWGGAGFWSFNFFFSDNQTVPQC